MAKTRYILVGGQDWKAPDGGRALLEAILKDVPKPAKALICYFARPREDWERKFVEEQQRYQELAGDRLRLTMAYPDVFEQQVAETDILLIKGGDEALLDYYLSSFGDLEALFAGKTVVGSSAGADYLADSFWTPDWRTVGKGVGLVKVSIIPHFGSTAYLAGDPRGPIDWQAAKKELESYGRNVPIHCLAEGEFVVIDDEN